MIHYFDEFLKILHQKGELLTITRHVDTNQEIAEITDRQASRHNGGKALLFTDTGTVFPIVTNVFSSEKRIALAFEMDTLDDVCNRISAFYQAIAQSRTSNRFMRRSPISEFNQYIPKASSAGSCQEIALFPPDLNRIPFLRNRAFDQAHSLHEVPLLIKNPYLDTYNIESTRLLWHSKTTVQVKFEPGSQASLFINESPQARIPVALFFGGDPLYTLTGIVPQAKDVDPLLLGGYLRRKAIVKVPCLSQPLEVPENCDLVIEGYIDKNAQQVASASCGESTGFYSTGGKEPLMHVTCVTHRKDPKLLLNIPSLGVMRSRRHLAKAISVFVETNIEQTIAMEVRRLCFPYFAENGSAAIIAIRKYYPGQTYKVAHAFWGSSTTYLNKLLILVDEHVDVTNMYEVNECLKKYYNPSRDTFFSRGPLSISDHAAPQSGFGGKICIDATKKAGNNLLKPSTCKDPFLFFHKSEADHKKYHSDIRMVIAVDEEVDLKDKDLCFWMMINQTDPIRDVSIENGVLVVDACTKKKGDPGVLRSWPNICCSSKEIIENVDKYWERLKIGEFIPSPSLRFYPFLRKGNAHISE